MSTSDDAIGLIRVRGIDPRTQRLLTYEAIYRQTQYRDRGLKPWELTETSNGTLVPMRQRQPGVMGGDLTEKVNKLVDRLIGEGRFASISVDDGAEGDEPTPDVEHVQDVIGLEAVNIEAAVELPALDVVIKGSGALGFSRPDLKRWEPLYLAAEWCEPVFVSQNKGTRARTIAEELAEVAGVELPSDGEGVYLPAPVGAGSEDICFLRYQYRYHQEEKDRAGGAAARKETWWKRRDYLPDVIVEYVDLKVNDDATAAPLEWEALPVDPHGWGVVPIAWIRGPGAAPGDIDGPSFLMPALISMAEEVDYTLSQAGKSVRYNCSPILCLIDVIDQIRQENLTIDPGAENYIPTDPEAVLQLRSIGEEPSVELLETSGAAAASAHDHVDKLKGFIGKISGMVDFDQAEAAGTMSGVAIERMLEPTIARVKAYRKVMGAGVRLIVQKLLKALRADGEVSSEMTTALEWPRIVQLTADDVRLWAEALGGAKERGLVSQETAVRIMATQLEIDDPEAELERVIDAEDLAMKAALELARSRPPEDEDDDEGAAGAE